MQRFQFRLQRLLDWETRLCHMEEEKLRAALGALSETDEKLARVKADSLAMEQEWLKHASLSATDLRSIGAFRSAAVRREHQLMAERWQRTQTAEEQRKKVQHRRRRLRVIETLRARALAQYEEAMERELETLAAENHLATHFAGRQEARPGR